MSKCFAVVAAAGLACALATLVAGAAEATRSVEISGGFTPDPMTLDVTVAGERPADDFVRGCPGFVAASESVAVTLSAPATALGFYLRGEDTAALLLRGPDGIYRCAGVDENGIARVPMDRLMEGVFTLWPAVGGMTTARAVTVLVTERELAPYEVTPFDMPTAASLEPARLGEVAVDPQYGDAGQQLAQGSVAAGTVEAGRMLEGCAGVVDPSAADLTVTLAEPLPEFSLYAESDDDTVLLVLDPDGGWWCVDDAAGHNPAVTVAPAPAGRYQLLVAGYSTSGGSAVTLLASPGEPRWSQDWSAGGAAPEIDLGLGEEPLAGRHSLPAEGALEVPVILRAGVPAHRYVDRCSGEIDPAQPHVVLHLTETEPSLHVYATSADDSALMVITPDRDAYCDDDTYGLHPEVVVSNAPPGDYEVWVALTSGTQGSDAVVGFSREAPADPGAGSASGAGHAVPNPLIGREFSSAAEALAILLDETPLGEILGFARIEARGAEGFTLHDAVVHDPEGEQEPVAIARIEVDNLDLEGLRERGEPARFALRAEGIDYAAIAADMREGGLVPLPQIEGAPTATLAVSVLPVAGDAGRVNAQLLARLDGQLALRVAAVGSPAVDLPPQEQKFENLRAESIEVELQNLGYLKLLLAEQAAQAGTSVEQLTAGMLDDLRGLLAPMEPGSLRAQLLAAIEAALADPGRPGALRLQLKSSEPQSFDDMIELAIQDSTPAAGPVQISIEYLLQ